MRKVNKPVIVLDASAYLALVYREPGYEQISAAAVEQTVVMSAVNVAEVIAKQSELALTSEQTLSWFYLTGVQIEPFHAEDAAISGSFRKVTKPYGLSLGDRACLALGRRLNAPVFTADRIWNELELGIHIVCVR